MAKTLEEIKALKDSWIKDPCWDIETEPGFEDHYQELLAFRTEQELTWQIEAEEKIDRRARVVGIDTGIMDSTIAQSIHTFEEIENQITKSDEAGDRNGIEAAHARATLLLTAQMKRIADALEARNEDEEAESQWMVKFLKGE